MHITAALQFFSWLKVYGFLRYDGQKFTRLVNLANNFVSEIPTMPMTMTNYFLFCKINRTPPAGLSAFQNEAPPAPYGLIVQRARVEQAAQIHGTADQQTHQRTSSSPAKGVSGGATGRERLCHTCHRSILCFASAVFFTGGKSGGLQNLL